MSALEEMAATVLKKVLGADGVEKINAFISSALQTLNAMKIQQDQIAADVQIIKMCVVQIDPAERMMQENIRDMYEQGLSPLSQIEQDTARHDDN